MSPRVRRRDVIRGIGAAGVMGLAGCNGGGGETIQLGVLMGVTGGLEQLGPPIRAAAEAPAAQISDGDTDFDVETRFEDTQTDPDEGIRGGEALVDAGYPMFVGALASDVSLPVAESVAIPNEVIQVSPASTAVPYSDLEGDWTFRTTASDEFQGRVLARIASERLEAATAGVLVRDDPYGRGLGQQFVDVFEGEYGGTITGGGEVVTVDPDASSFVPQLETALADDPDTLFVVAFSEEGVQIFRDFYGEFDRGDMPVLVPDGLQDPELPGNVGESFDNVTGTGPGVEDELANGLETFRGLVDNPDGVFVREGYDAAAVLCLARVAAGESDSAAIRDGIRDVANEGGETVTAENLVEGVEMAAEGTAVNYQGLSGPVEIDDNGDVQTASYNYFEFTDDGLNILDTIVVEG